MYSQQVNVLKLGRMPSVVVVDKSGIIRLVYRGDSMKDTLSESELLGIVKLIG